MTTTCGSSCGRRWTSCPTSGGRFSACAFFENMSNKEIGERLGLTVSTVENHMYLALKNLRDKLL